MKEIEVDLSQYVFKPWLIERLEKIKKGACSDCWKDEGKIDQLIKELKPSICDTAPYPECNGANGCDTCEHQEEE